MSIILCPNKFLLEGINSFYMTNFSFTYIDTHQVVTIYCGDFLVPSRPIIFTDKHIVMTSSQMHFRDIDWKNKHSSVYKFSLILEQGKGKPTTLRKGSWKFCEKKDNIREHYRLYLKCIGLILEIRNADEKCWPIS